MGEFTYEQVEVNEAGHTLSGLVWQRFHRPMPGVVEEALSVNQGLADQGTFIPPGTSVVIPVPIPRSNREPEAIRLW